MSFSDKEKIEKIFTKYCRKHEQSLFFKSKGFSEKTMTKFYLVEVDTLAQDEDFKSLFPGKSKEFYFNYKYIIPGFDETGKIDYLMFRRDENCDVNLKTKKSENYLHKHEYAGEISRGLGKLYNIESLLNPVNNTLFIVESWTDALSIEESGFSAIAMNRVANANTVLKKLLEHYKDNLSSTHFIVMCDNDEIGQQADKEIAMLLKQFNLQYIILNDYPKGIKDSNEWLLFNRNQFKEYLSKIVKDTKQWEK